MLPVTEQMAFPEPMIAPRPDDAVRAAIRRALVEPDPAVPGWAEAALAEGVSAGAAEPLQEHDVCSLW